MKKTLLTGGLIALTFSAFAQFTTGRLVVSQYGDGVDPLASVTVPVFLKEFKPNGGVATYTLPMPIANGAPGTNQAFTGKPDQSNEGLIALSPNGTYLSMYGYGIIPGSTLQSADNRTIGLVTANGIINTTTSLPGSSSVSNPRSAITVDGTGFWIGSSGGGVRYTELGSTSTTAVNSSPLGAMRSVNIFNGQLYETTNSSSAPHIGTITSASDGNKLPKSTVVNNANTSPVALSGLNSLPSHPNQIVLLKTTVGAGDPNLIYATNDDTGNIEKWVLSSGTWVAKGTVKGSTESGALSLKGITARIIGDTAFVYANSATQLIAIKDTLNLSKNISDINNTITILATAPTNTIFKGVAFTPGTDPSTIAHIVLPVKLSSFTGKNALNGVQLSWATASEKNNSHFEVLRSTDGQTFIKIGEVAGNGNSDATLNYTFLDRDAVAGTNYYKLNQVDYNGKTEEFGPVAVTVNGGATDISVYANRANGQINVTVYANINGNATLNIYDANGRNVANKNVNLQPGNNTVSLNSQNTGAGLHIATLMVDGITLTKKFAFQ